MATALWEIEEALVTRLQSKLDDARKIAVQRGVEGFPQPAVYCSADSAKFERVTSESYKQIVTLYVDIIFKDLGNEQRRRKGITMILEGVIQALLLQDLDLDIAPIRPQSFRNTTTDDLRDQGLMAFTLELDTWLYLARVDDEVLVDLLRIGMEYYLMPDDDTVYASDLVELGA